MINLIIITKNEAKEMRKLGYGEHIHTGKGSYHRRYLTENSKALKALEQYRTDNAKQD